MDIRKAKEYALQARRAGVAVAIAVSGDELRRVARAPADAGTIDAALILGDVTYGPRFHIALHAKAEVSAACHRARQARRSTTHFQ